MQTPVEPGGYRAFAIQGSNLICEKCDLCIEDLFFVSDCPF